MRKILVTVLLAGMGLACSTMAAGAGLFSATRIVIAIVGDDLYLGEAEGHLNGAGTLVIHAQKNPEFVCRGQFTSTSAARSGAGQLHCSDGSIATFQFKRLSVFTGYGVGSFGRSTMSFAYGLSHLEVGPYLKLPDGKKLMQNGTDLALAEL
jgi:hypothetical protein